LSRLATDADAPRRVLRLSLETLEIVRGHDGLLRGKPEPVLLVAIYRTNAATPAFVAGRTLVRVKLKGALPANVTLKNCDLRYDARFATTERLVVLVVAAEEDSGSGVERISAALESPESLLLYALLDAEPAPEPLDAWACVGCAAPTAIRVEVLAGAETSRTLSQEGEYVAACAFNLGATERQDEIWRLPFADRESRNEWVLSLRMRVG
jgi:hypothetical protein